jgi:Ca2+-binding EF-hand superfamily protein
MRRQEPVRTAEAERRRRSSTRRGTDTVALMFDGVNEGQSKQRRPQAARCAQWLSALCLMACGLLLLTVYARVRDRGGTPVEQQRQEQHSPPLLKSGPDHLTRLLLQQQEQQQHAAAQKAAALAEDVKPELMFRESHANLRNTLLQAVVAADEDKDGKLSLKEVSMHVNRLSQRSKERFALWDADGSGALTAAEVRSALIEGGHNEAAVSRWQDELQQMDMENRGWVSVDEFVGAACKPCIMMALDSNRDGFIDRGELMRHENDSLSFGSVLQWLVGDNDLRDLKLRTKDAIIKVDG